MPDLSNLLSDSPRFLITRLSAIGDCIHTVPIVHALRSRFPACHISWATQPGPATLLCGAPGLDEIIPIKRGWLKSWKSIQSVRKKLRSLKPDVCIDPQGLTKSSALAWFSNANHRIGFATPQGRELSLYFNNLRITAKADHVVDRYLELLEPLGIVKPDASFRMAECEESDSTIANFLQGVSGPFVVMNPGAGWPSKIWPADRYRLVARELGITLGIRTIVAWAGDEEFEMAKTIAKDSEGFAVLAPGTSLPELRSLVRRASQFIGSDTGPMHLAAAMGIPCVALFGPTRPERCGPYGNGHAVLHTPIEGNKQLRSDDNRAMLLTTVEEVVAASLKLLHASRDNENEIAAA